jgi:hypothetical protein
MQHIGCQQPLNSTEEDVSGDPQKIVKSGIPLEDRFNREFYVLWQECLFPLLPLSFPLGMFSRLVGMYDVLYVAQS